MLASEIKAVLVHYCPLPLDFLFLLFLIVAPPPPPAHPHHPHPQFWKMHCPWGVYTNKYGMVNSDPSFAVMQWIKSCYVNNSQVLRNVYLFSSAETMFVEGPEFARLLPEFEVWFKCLKFRLYKMFRNHQHHTHILMDPIFAHL